MAFRLPGIVIKEIHKPAPLITEGFCSRKETGTICKRLGFGKVLLVTDKTLFSLGYHEEVVSSLKECGISVSVFSDISSEPTASIVVAGKKQALKSKAQAIIALGGGSVLDSSKMIACAATLKHKSVRSLLLKFLIVPGKTIPLICIPSTAGTGAEITVGAVIKKNEKGSKCSTVICGLNVVHVILDSQLTVKSPASVTAACGIDALSHGLEGVVAAVRVGKEDKLKSFECVKLVLENLPKVLEKPDNLEARQAMCKAALYGGNAINKQLAGYVHAFAHSIGAMYHIPHGNAIALSLMPVMNEQKKKCTKKLNELAKYCNFEDCEELLGKIQDLINLCNFKSMGSFIPEKDFKKLTEKIIKDSVNYSAPKIFTISEIHRVIMEINKNGE